MQTAGKLSFLFLLLISLTLIGCSKDDEDASVEVRVNGTVLFDGGDDFNGDIDGDFVGSGGSATRIFTWRNNLSTADYNADITASKGGTFTMVVKDSDGQTVLDRGLSAGTEPDSFSGVTRAGTPGLWTVTLELTAFNGSGSFSLSEGD
ncbi:hypothetical protein GGR26_002917 [Lewinella marina]|uniref:CHRD domain-containing protein n=1 Tax=Neolewinella marina TaxID=438751 RepID=A0A2G0CBI1_9BACT|nr:hypothetical protein [Neolewinella marina]NJB87140.1 hypothetical protein [Neolewinella marina]PHK97333.1 hypothetical protein CGL56_16130 [Neolewinella marina]